ncbi:hypothetical protein NPS70_16435 [Streptomyces sp. C10-9-1]|uniref:hypothetical protein n=1 Tax=Streptomyces sp. C10-9-1 TaxID=1859285 RepID=UPI00211147D7|nr:hypothetical protein [Streptomyces sp. C10-9-1]MCQ6554774.1 hypothetical protein [Streptomyces sp. C10-9-1]
MTLNDHARAIADAIRAAADAGYYLDDGTRTPTTRLELNLLDEYGDPVEWVALDLPDNPL